MASEDSDQLRSGCLAIHRLDDLRDLYETVGLQMSTRLDYPHTECELFEVCLLGRPKRMGFKERDDGSKKLIASSHDELSQVFSMIVVALADVHAARAEEAAKLLQRTPTRDALRHNKPMRHLEPGSVASAVLPTWLSDEPDGEASLSVHKANHPAELDQSFLLVSCTHGIVTVSVTWDGTRSLGYSGFPAYSRILTTWLPT